jgi:tRNA(Arg) A34 adenosine deaminase TadA
LKLKAKIIQQGIEQALLSKGVSRGSFRLGAILFDKKGRTLSKGHNKYKTHPMAKKFGGYGCIHAEQDAIVCNRNVENSYLFVCRIKKDGTFGLAFPCDVCYSMLKYKKIKGFYFTHDNGQILYHRY